MERTDAVVDSDDAGRGLQIEGRDFDVRLGRRYEVKDVSGGVEMELGAEDRVGILYIAKFSLNQRDIWGFREKKAENSNSGAGEDGFAPAVLGAADWSRGCFRRRRRRVEAGVGLFSHV